MIAPAWPITSLHQSCVVHSGGVYLDRMDLVQEQIKEWGIWLFLGQFCMSYSFSIFLMSASFTCLVFLPHTGGEIVSQHRHLDELLVSGKPTRNLDRVRMECTIFIILSFEHWLLWCMPGLFRNWGSPHYQEQECGGSSDSPVCLSQCCLGGAA